MASHFPHVQLQSSSSGHSHRRSQDFVCGGALFCQKVDDLVLVVALKDSLNIRPNLSHPAKTVLKIDSCSGWGCTSCPGGALTHFSCKLGLKNFPPPWGCRFIHCTPWLRLWSLSNKSKPHRSSESQHCLIMLCQN